MNTLLVGINAKYIHSNLGIRYIKEYVKKNNKEINIAEYTINQSLDYILGEIYKKRPDILGLSCYIWNIEIIKILIVELKKILPHTYIVLGGPEVSYDCELIMNKYEDIDAIIYGEGEKTFLQLLLFKNGELDIHKIKGIAYRNNNEIIKNKSQDPMHLDELPFVYKDGYDEFENRIIYYESTRGCPFNCQYCLSSIEKGVRFRSFNLVKDELQSFLDNKVMQVKFVDRTFNCNKEHAMTIWKYLHENDNGYTNFHFEISADLLDDLTIDFLSQVRKGLFQFEIGVQSTNMDTLNEIKRTTKLDILTNNILKLKKANNIHLHLDLIAGLPYESYEAFRKSFNNVYNMEPEQLQLGFLKVLKGSGIDKNSKNLGIEYREYAPYEVLYTKDISYAELEKLKLIEEMVEVYYNSGNFYNTLKYIETFFESPFSIYEDLANYWIEKGYYHVNHSKIGMYNILYEFITETRDINTYFLEELIKLDLYLQEKVKKFPYFIKSSTDNFKSQIIDFYKDSINIDKYLPQLKDYTSKQISRMAHIEVFEYNIELYIRSNYKTIRKEPTPILFNYHNRDKMRHNASLNSLKLI